MNKISKRKCIICEEVFEYRTKPNCRVNKIKSYRGKNMITCSSKCSKIYDRVSHYVRSKLNQSFKKNDKFR